MKPFFIRVLIAVTVYVALQAYSFADSRLQSSTATIKTTEGKLISVKLAEDEQLAHPVVKGNLGPWKAATVVLTRPKGEDNHPFQGRVIVHSDDGLEKVLPLPPPYEPMGIYYLTVNSVMFRDVDRGGEKSLIILYTSEKRQFGGGKTFSANAVYRWNGSEFEHVDSVEKQLFGAASAAQVDKRLAKLKKGKK